MQVAPVSQQIWDMKYRLKTLDGHPVDKTIADSWARVAEALAEPETDRSAWAAAFRDAMADFKFLPAGRILSGAGSGRRVTLFNCFVMGDVPDDMTGIFEHLKEAAVTMQQGGGIGYDFSTLRPKGSAVIGVGADASGPLSFMDVWDAMCRTIMSAGSRRGAMMAVMRCDHPDIEAFIEAKREPGRLRMFNLSVLVGDAFMRAVKEDAPWELSFGGTVYKSLGARDLWDKIMRATYAYAEPGVVFIDRINRLNNLHYCETIHGTNPCVTADTWVHTTGGPRTVHDLVGRPFTALVNGEPFASTEAGFFQTATKPVLRVATREGHALRLTVDHRVQRLRDQRMDWAPAGELRPGDAVVLNDHRVAADWPGPYTREQGYLVGLLLGDGALTDDEAVISAWPGLAAVNGHDRPGIAGVMDAALDAAETLPQRSELEGWVPIPGRGEYRLVSGALRQLAAELGLDPEHRTVTPALERTSGAFCRGFLRGLFDVHGGVHSNARDGVGVRLRLGDDPLLRAAQRMLLRLGIVGVIVRDERPVRHRPLPDGRGGERLYPSKARHELVIAGDNLALFGERVGFADETKAVRLEVLMSSYRRALAPEPFTATVAAVTEDGTEPVYDVQIPGINAFDANGLVVHNCGEQPLPPYGTCLLGSVNLARLIVDPFEKSARIDMDALGDLVGAAVRMLDNVIDVSRYPLAQQGHEARAKRRIGLGITGLADALIQCGARYGGHEAVALTETWMRAIQRAAYLTSVRLAEEKGPFPLFERDKYLAGETVGGLDEDVRDAIAKHGIRNALLTSVAPTGTISLFADNVSSGLEPVFSFRYARHVLMPDGSRREEEVTDYAYRLYRRLKGEDAALTHAFVDAEALSPNDHLVMQAAVQKYIDSSISKTINCPDSISFDDFKDIYAQAYELGCKGCTTYRPNEVTGAVLERREDANSKASAQAELPLEAPAAQAKPKDLGDSGAIVQMFQPLDRPEALPGQTYKVRWPESDHAIYITLNDIIQDGRRRPFEVFINSKDTEHYAWTVALTRMISAVFRRGGDVSFVVEELKAVFDPRGGQWVGGRYVPSLLAAIGGVIEQHMIDIGFIPPPEGHGKPRAEKQVKAVGETPNARFRSCPKCGSPTLIRQEDCDTCTSCGYSKCG